MVNELLGALGRDPRGTETVVLCFAPTSGTEMLRRGVVLRRCRTLTTVASAPLSTAMASAYLSARRRADIVHVHVPNPWAVLLVLVFLVLVFPPHGAIAGRPARAAAHPRGRPIRPPPHEGVATTD